MPGPVLKCSDTLLCFFRSHFLICVLHHVLYPIIIHFWYFLCFTCLYRDNIVAAVDMNVTLTFPFTLFSLPLYHQLLVLGARSSALKLIGSSWSTASVSSGIMKLMVGEAEWLSVCLQLTCNGHFMVVTADAVTTAGSEVVCVLSSWQRRQWVKQMWLH